MMKKINSFISKACALISGRSSKQLRKYNLQQSYSLNISICLLSNASNDKSQQSDRSNLASLKQVSSTGKQSTIENTNQLLSQPSVTTSIESIQQTAVAIYVHPQQGTEQFPMKPNSEQQPTKKKPENQKEERDSSELQELQKQSQPKGVQQQIDISEEPQKEGNQSQKANEPQKQNALHSPYQKNMSLQNRDSNEISNKDQTDQASSSNSLNSQSINSQDSVQTNNQLKNNLDYLKFIIESINKGDWSRLEDKINQLKVFNQFYEQLIPLNNVNLLFCLNNFINSKVCETINNGQKIQWERAECIFNNSSFSPYQFLNNCNISAILKKNEDCYQGDDICQLIRGMQTNNQSITNDDDQQLNSVIQDLDDQMQKSQLLEFSLDCSNSMLKQENLQVKNTQGHKILPHQMVKQQTAEFQSVKEVDGNQSIVKHCQDHLAKCRKELLDKSCSDTKIASVSIYSTSSLNGSLSLLFRLMPQGYVNYFFKQFSPNNTIIKQSQNFLIPMPPDMHDQNHFQFATYLSDGALKFFDQSSMISNCSRQQWPIEQYSSQLDQNT